MDPYEMTEKELAAYQKKMERYRDAERDSTRNRIIDSFTIKELRKWAAEDLGRYKWKGMR